MCCERRSLVLRSDQFDSREARVAPSGVPQELNTVNEENARRRFVAQRPV
jgi:hypothetical protein